MAGYRNSKAIRPHGEDVVAIKAEEERADIWTSLPGKVVSYDPEKQTITAEVQYKPRHNGKPVDMPQLLEVPVIFPRGGGAALTFPVKEGDGVLLNFAARDFGKWYNTGQASEAATAEMHGLSSAVAILGFEPSTRRLQNVNPSAIEFRNEDGSRKMSFDPATGSFKTDAGSDGGGLEFRGRGGEELLQIIHDLATACWRHEHNNVPVDSPELTQFQGIVNRVLMLMGQV